MSSPAVLPPLTSDVLAATQPSGTLFSRAGMTADHLRHPYVPVAGAAPGVALDPDGIAIAGLCWRTDYAGQEERGCQDLRTWLTGPDPRSFLVRAAARGSVRAFADVRAIALSLDELPAVLTWGQALDVRPWARTAHEPAYVRHFADRAAWTRGVGPQHLTLNRLTMPELRELARQLDLRPVPRRKADLVAALAGVAGVPEPDAWPAWFADGTTLVIRVDDEPDGTLSTAARILDGLRDAIEAGTLALGSGSGPFVTGLFLHDGRDLTPALLAAVAAHADWDDAAMAAVAPARQALVAAGLQIYHLGGARPGGWKRARYTILPEGQEQDWIVEDAQVRYFLNASLPMGRRHQSVYGWFTAAELTLAGVRERAEEIQAQNEAAAARRSARDAAPVG